MFSPSRRRKIPPLDGYLFSLFSRVFKSCILKLILAVSLYEEPLWLLFLLPEYIMHSLPAPIKITSDTNGAERFAACETEKACRFCDMPFSVHLI